MRKTLAFTLVISAAAFGCTKSDQQATPAPPPPPAAPVAPPAAAASNAPDTTGMKKTSTGLAYKDLVVGTGTTAAAGKQVEVHYVGQLPHGRVFDSNRDGQPPLTFVLGAHRVVDGFDQGITGMKVGGKRLVMIPPALGYGAAGSGPVPPNATMVFTIDCVSVK